MAKNNQRQRNLTITDKLTLSTNAIVRIRNSNDYDEISLTELAILSGLTSTTAELNIMDGVTATATELNIIDGVTATTAELNILDGVTATANEINQKCDVSTLHEAVTATNVITSSETGKHFVLNTATAFVSTLPAVALGLEYWFHVGATEPTTSHTIVTDSSANIIIGNITSTDLDAAGDVSVVTDADTISFIANKAKHGDFAHVWSDGTNWYLDGMCKAFDGMTTTQAS